MIIKLREIRDWAQHYNEDNTRPVYINTEHIISFTEYRKKEHGYYETKLMGLSTHITINIKDDDGLYSTYVAETPDEIAQAIKQAKTPNHLRPIQTDEGEIYIDPIDIKFILKDGDNRVKITFRDNTSIYFNNATPTKIHNQLYPQPQEPQEPQQPQLPTRAIEV
jgi:hypothetical protein